ncbi:MAG: hypothetical protein VX278_22300, partial [Myxococcota bacterium]|nr:hypothetical protein [Myxococcota bacterium]
MMSFFLSLFTCFSYIRRQTLSNTFRRLISLILLSIISSSWGLEWSPCFQRNAEAQCSSLDIPLTEGNASLDLKLLPAIQPAH